ncbi:MAG: hypothetical protein CL946_07235 [Ectothiorhodospiraceae bacterium]|nr:hypothetical protein [Ectothiorhodospiraceae bacterium]
MQRPQFSFIIPTLNEELLLPKLLRQIFGELNGQFSYEVIISDGGSTDSTISAAEQFPVSCVSSLNGKKQTIALGRNMGAEKAHGEYYVFVNADIQFQNVQKFLSAIQTTFRNPKIAGATCRVHVFPEEETFTDRFYHVLMNTYFSLLNFIGEGMGRGECQIVRADVYEKTGGYNPQIVAGEDYDFFRRVSKHGKIVNLPGIKLYESPRRFRKLGYAKILRDWAVNGLSVRKSNASRSEEWEPVR